MARCTGQCCDYFLLVGPPEKVARRARRARLIAGADSAAAAEWDAIEAMIIYRGLVANPNRPDSAPDHYYTCKHHDKVTGDCMAYDTRPNMCRNFPNGRQCPNVGCTMTDGTGCPSAAPPTNEAA